MARFTRRARLLRPSDFDAAFKRGQRKNDRWLSIVTLKNPLGYSRLGLAVSRKSVPLSVDRNRIKRQIRESFRHHQHRLGGTDIVIVTRHGCTRARADELSGILERLWTRIEASSAASSSS